MENVLFRGSASKGFRAPSLYDVFMPDSQTIAPTSSTIQCAAQAGFRQMAATNPRLQSAIHGAAGGSRSLAAEKASSLTFGLVIEPVKSVTPAPISGGPWCKTA
ncbi:hypothetical protein [Chromobacterium sphagni]|uniref:hypothetical protein n=1 Tax=Chromobacterium sphagni TaxID=1903179 RepID=UPI003B97ECE3